MAAILACGTAPAAVRAAAPLKIGLLTPFSGPLARVAEANRNCLMMAVDEINAAGGLLGQALQIVSEDSQMSAKVSLDKARKLLAGDGVAMVTGMVLPFEREAVLQVASRYRRLVVYPNFDEGRCHPLLLTTGLASNQRVVPLIDWAVAQAGKSFFVLASDIGSNRSTLLPQIEAAIQARGGRLLGTRFFPFGTRDYGPALQQIQGLGADVVWHSIGDDPVSFVKQYRSFGMKPQLITDIAHESLAMSTEGALAGTVGVSSYFMGVENPENQRFLDTYTRRFSDATPLRVGGHVVMLPHGESTYAGAKLFAAAAGRAGSIEADAVKKALPGVSLRMPRGAVGVDAGASHLQCQTMIGRARKDGGFDLLGAAPSIQAQCGAA
ncbi:ABC transporter substrate-binding protein [Paracidovorax citrulli]|nr:ABC transporter substrate-binding protein [Paracidovorax citrulli]UMT90756.1 ABC transporter substrate-binding protein [Paracidovorax citrulli]UMT97822.1 ABC transporter substrate-binding protein [Paracidovorax citrulli]